MWDDVWPIPKANLCDRCRYVTFNDLDKQGQYLCNVCKEKK